MTDVSSNNKTMVFCDVIHSRQRETRAISRFDNISEYYEFKVGIQVRTLLTCGDEI